MENNVGEEICENCYLRLKRFAQLHIINFKEYKIEEQQSFNNYSRIQYLDCLIYFFKYKGDIRKLILDYKFFNKYYLGKVFSKIILKNVKICRKLKFYDIIIPVPMHKIKKRERGYNQAEILAEDLAKQLNINYDNNILIKTVNNKRQSSLTEKERYENINKVFKVQKMDKIKNKNIILVDDICTTSATIEECSKILKKAGASKVTALVIAKD